MSRYCNICGQSLHEQHFIYRRGASGSARGLIVCAGCERTAARCTACRVPINPSVDPDGFCATCRNMLPRCASCGKLVHGPYYRVNSSEAIFCTSCFTGRPRCDVCGGVATPGGYKLHDERHICAICHKTAVYDSVRANELYERVFDLVTVDLGLQIGIRPAFAMVDRNQMRALVAQTGARGLGSPDLVHGLFSRRGRERTIYVEYGLPQILMIQVIAHELAHAWEGENCPLLRDPLLREGFAEWVAYRVLLALDATKKAALMLQRTDLYGQGLQAVMALERQGGTAAVIGACRENQMHPTP